MVIHHRLGSWTADLRFSQLWRLDVDGQSAGRFSVWWGRHLLPLSPPGGRGRGLSGSVPSGCWSILQAPPSWFCDQRGSTPDTIPLCLGVYNGTVWGYNSLQQALWHSPENKPGDAYERQGWGCEASWARGPPAGLERVQDHLRGWWPLGAQLHLPIGHSCDWPFISRSVFTFSSGVRLIGCRAPSTGGLQASKPWETTHP